MTFFWYVLFGIWRAGGRGLLKAASEEEENSCKMEQLEPIINMTSTINDDLSKDLVVL